MSRRSIGWMWASLALFIVALSVVLRVFVTRSFEELENTHVRNNVNRVINAITERELSISAKASDWAAWDDAYQFMQDGNDRFIRSNFALSAFTGNDYNLIAYTRNSGEIAYARWYYPGAHRTIPVPEDVRREITRKGPLTIHKGPRNSFWGIVMLDKQGPMLVASRPVVTSNEQGPIRGSLIFGQLLDPEAIQGLSRVTRVQAAIKRLDTGSLPSNYVQARERILKSKQVIVQPISKREVIGYTTIDDIYGNPALMLRVEMPRTIYQRGITLSDYALAALMILSIILGIIASLLVARTVRKERELDQKAFDFYRRTITAATDGKLHITDHSNIEKMFGTPIAQWNVRLPSDLPEIRDKAVDVAESMGIEHERSCRFAVCVGEAVTNAIKHAGGGKASLHQTPDGLVFVMSDHGPGIPALTLPDVALRRGYSTTGTLGMGYKIMISFGDRTYLSTGPKGTTVAIEMKAHPESATILDIVWRACA